MEKKAKFRVIESSNKRIVHFLFNPGHGVTTSPFARKYKRFMIGDLSEFTSQEKVEFQTYIQKMIDEELDEGERNPIVYDDMPYFSFHLANLSRLSFSTADDPFYKARLQKYYPECVVVDESGEIIQTIGPNCHKDDSLQMNYQDDFRDPVLKINDDRKVQMHLSSIQKPGVSIFLFVREFDLTDKPVQEGEFDRAWFRLSNEETNQTLDYSLIKKVEIPDDFNPVIVDEDNEEAPPKRNELIYLHGRLYLDSKGKWVFESYKHCF